MLFVGGYAQMCLQDTCRNNETELEIWREEYQMENSREPLKRASQGV